MASQALELRSVWAFGSRISEVNTKAFQRIVGQFLLRASLCYPEWRETLGQGFHLTWITAQAF